MIEKLIIGKPQYSCPVCDVEWYESDLESIGDLGCPGCCRKFDLEDYMHEDEPLYHDWRQKCYDRLMKEYDRNSDGDKLVQEYEAICNELAAVPESESNLFRQILNDERDENSKIN